MDAGPRNDWTAPIDEKRLEWISGSKGNLKLILWIFYGSFRKSLQSGEIWFTNRQNFREEL
jgi:hypothetical protein